MPQSLIILSRSEIDKMRAAGRLAARILKALGDHVEPGVSTQELDELAVRLTNEAGAVSAPFGYKGYPRSICTSLNEVVCHGIPSPRERLTEGDIVAIDVTPKLDGFHGDTCATYPVGVVSEVAMRLIDATREAMWRGIRVVKAGNYVGDIGAAISDYVEPLGFSVVRDFVGHGVGTTFHAPPQVPHFKSDRRGIRLRPGMTFTIEPMINVGGGPTEILSDGWTAVTQDRSLSAQFEHTVVVTSDGVEVLTLLEG